MIAVPAMCVGCPFIAMLSDVGHHVPGSKFHVMSPLVAPWKPPIQLVGTWHSYLDWTDAMEAKN